MSPLRGFVFNGRARAASDIIHAGSPHRGSYVAPQGLGSDGSTQLLCEQVVGRGLRRTSYDVDEKTKLFKPEYVNIFGVPFTFMPHEGGEGPPPPPPHRKRASSRWPRKTSLR